MKSNALPLALALMSSYTFAATPKEVSLSHAYVSHISEQKTLSSKAIDLSPLNDKKSSWHVSCDYRIIGQGSRTDVNFTIPGNELINLGEDYHPYDNSGLTKKEGKLNFSVDQTDLNYGKALVVINYDLKNDIKISNCKAMWLDG